MTGEILTDDVPRRSVLKYGAATSGALAMGSAMTESAVGKRHDNESGRGRRATVVVLSGETQPGRIYEITGTVEEDGQVCSPRNPDENSVNCYTAKRNCSNGARSTMCVTEKLPIDSFWEVTEGGAFCDEDREPPTVESGPCAVRVKQVDGCPEE